MSLLEAMMLPLTLTPNCADKSFCFQNKVDSLWLHPHFWRFKAAHHNAHVNPAVSTTHSPPPSALWKRTRKISQNNPSVGEDRLLLSGFQRACACEGDFHTLRKEKSTLSQFSHRGILTIMTITDILVLNLSLPFMSDLCLYNNDAAEVCETGPKPSWLL